MSYSQYIKEIGRGAEGSRDLTSDDAQRLYADGNFEYPVNPAVQASEIVRSWGAFTPDTLNIAEIARFEPAAAKLVDEVQFND